MFILNINPKVIVITLKSNSIGVASPKFSPYDSHHNHSTFEASSPSNPPITNPDNKNTNNSIYNLDIYKKDKRKLILSEYHNLNLVDSMKTASGSTTYEKIKYLNILPFEVKEIHLKVKLTKEEYLNLKIHNYLYNSIPKNKGVCQC